MAVLNNPDEYYGDPQDDWALGDIAIVPTVILWAQEERPPDLFVQSAPQPDGTTSVTIGLWRGNTRFKDPVAQYRLSPAMVVIDDCVIDKEFNERVELLMADGVERGEAESIVREDRTLDQVVSVVPIQPYNLLRPREQGVRDGQTVGYFPVVKSSFMDEGFLDFVHKVPVSLLPTS